MRWTFARAAARWLLAAACLGALATTRAQSPVTEVPRPVYTVNGNSLNIHPSNLPRPEDAADHIESTFATWVLDQGLRCKARAARFRDADFRPRTPLTAYSANTEARGIAAEKVWCVGWEGQPGWERCNAWACGADPFPHRYHMVGICPNGWNFDVRGGKPGCHCPTGTELVQGADGLWHCQRPCTPSSTDPHCHRNDLVCSAGNPVLPGIAAKVHTEIDFAGEGAHPLSFVRSFRSHGARPYVAPGAWSHWVHNWGRRIDTYPEPGYAVPAYVVRADASQLVYRTDGGGSWQAAQVGDRNRLTELRDASGRRTGFQYFVFADDSVEHYDALGRLTSVVQRNGWTYRIEYSTTSTSPNTAPRPGLLIAVHNRFGHRLGLGYDGQGRLAALVPPGTPSTGGIAGAIAYRHDEAAGLGAGVPALGQLSSVRFPDGRVRRYHHEDPRYPRWITGVTDELGVRTGTYTYDSYGRVQRTVGPGGGNKLEFIHRGASTDVIDGSGATPIVSTYHWESAPGVLRPISVSAPCPLCGSSQASTAYTTSGDVARSVGHDGRVTFFAYDASGRETERATFPPAYATASERPALTLAESVTTTSWHPTWNLPVRRAGPFELTASNYDASGNLIGQSRQATPDATGAAGLGAAVVGPVYATTWVYGSGGQPVEIADWVDGVRTARWEYSYDAGGSLTRIVAHDASGTASADVSLDAAGRFTRIAADNGALALFRYGAHGKLVHAQLPDYTLELSYDARALLQEMRFSTGQWLRLEYDAAGVPVRLVPAPMSGPAIPIQEALVAGLSRVIAAAPRQAAVDDEPPRCCSDANAQLASAFEAQVREATAPVLLLQYAASRAVDALANELLLLKSARKLRQNMCRGIGGAAVQRPEWCHHTHHIVAVADFRAQRSRTILSTVGIDVNDAVNGVFVRCEQHSHLHTGSYYAQVQALLEVGLNGGKPGVIGMLALIRHRILTGAI